ncbi:MAG: outer membrane beta-barrel protein [Bacteroidales bacterium]
MRKRILLALFMISCFESYAQVNFEKGYFIDESDHRIECLIKNIDLRDNPTEFKYKINDEDPVRMLNILTIKEFGVYDVSKFVRSTVKIDRSSDEIANLSYIRNPIFKEESLFLNVLIEGKASLYMYVDGNFKRFFYKIEDSDIKQLIYKQYFVGKSIAINNFYMQQLFNDLKCQSITSNYIRNVGYNKKQLQQLFVKYNECLNVDFVNYEPKQKKILINLSFRPGFNFSKLKIENPRANVNSVNLDNELSFRLGLEAEFILPFNKNKWGIIIEPTYQYYKTKKTEEAIDITGGVVVYDIDYKSIELPLGFRHYFYFNEDSKLFANISFVFDFSKNSSVEYKRRDGLVFNSLKVKSNPNFAFGIGYKYLDKYSMEVRYQTSREILGDDSFKSDFRTLVVIFGYSFKVPSVHSKL